MRGNDKILYGENKMRDAIVQLKLRGLIALGLFVRVPSERKSAVANLLRFIRGLRTLGFREGGLKNLPKYKEAWAA
jgi:hypothetical protein